jgi:hypothetical protein
MMRNALKNEFIQQNSTIMNQLYYDALFPRILEDFLENNLSETKINFYSKDD